MKLKHTAYAQESGAVSVGWKAVLGRYHCVLLLTAGAWIQDLGWIL